MTFKAVIMLARREDMTAAEFQSWWLEDHAPLAAQLPGVRRIVFNSVPGVTGTETGDIDGISELWFDSQQDFEAAYAGELGQRVAADSMAHVRSRVRTFVVEHVVVNAPPAAH